MIERLVVKNYKKFDSLNLPLNKDLNIIVGDNESGKSTILECINLALNFKINGRFALNELNTFLFNKKIVDDYVLGIKTDSSTPLPEILIELYFSENPEISKLKGRMNSLRMDTPGLKVIIRFNESYAQEYATFILKNDEITTIPIEYYEIVWFSFADDAVTSRSIPVSSTILDATNIRLQDGTDSYIKSLINENLDSKQRVGLSLAFRNLKEKFFQHPSIDSINSVLKTRKGDITSKEIEVSLDVSQKNTWDSHLIPYLDKIPFQFSGMGEQNSIKLLLTLNNTVTECQIILIEELENHLSFSTMTQLLKRIRDKCEGKQIIITTHSTYVLNKLGIDNLILFGKENTFAKLSELDNSTRDYFEKLPGYDTLRMILAKKSILVEGPSDELIVQRAYKDSHQNRLPIEDGIDVICVRGLSFKRFLDIAKLLKLTVSVLTDNDGNYTKKITEKYAPYVPDTHIKIYASDNNALKTLEPQIVDVNTITTLNTILGTEFSTKEELVTYMVESDNKTDCALKIFSSQENIIFPQYVTDAISREE